MERRVPGYIYLIYALFLIPLLYLTFRLFTGDISLINFGAFLLAGFSIAILLEKKPITLWGLTMTLAPGLICFWFFSNTFINALPIMFYIVASFITLLLSLLNIKALHDMDAHHEVMTISIIQLTVLAIGMNVLVFIQKSLQLTLAELASRNVDTTSFIAFDINLLLGFLIVFASFAAPAVAAQHDDKEYFGLLIPLFLFAIGFFGISTFGIF